ncbi:MAG: hypothetical protein GF331_21220 [Chitinivibrionales bacterium]|nr:hypothetical protein [Chitinivibrionales bacterium]
MRIDELMAQVSGVDSWQPIRAFQSKRNVVSLVRAYTSPGVAELFVAKAYRDMEGPTGREAALLQLLYEQRAAVPRLIHACDGGLVLQYLPGPTVLSEMLRLERKGHRGDRGEAATLAFKLCEWLATFYRAMREHSGRSCVFGDMHLRNFILHQPSDILHGVDLESCTEGPVEQDIGMLCAHVATYDPALTPWRISFTRCLLATACRTLACHPETALRGVRRAIRTIARRRSVSYPREAVELLSQPF